MRGCGLCTCGVECKRQNGFQLHGNPMVCGGLKPPLNHLGALHIAQPGIARVELIDLPPLGLSVETDAETEGSAFRAALHLRRVSLWPTHGHATPNEPA